MSSVSAVHTKPSLADEPAAVELDAHAWLMLFVSLVSVLGILLLSVSHFRVPLLLGATLGACLLVHRLGRVGLSRSSPRWSWGLLLLLTLGVLLRSDVFPSMMGGQDQGLYTNYSVVMLRDGALNYVDHFREALPGALKAAYDDRVMASISMVDAQRSLMTIEFYPLHPMWMAIFAWAFGPALKTLSLVFFSVISIWSGKRLAQQVFGSERAGLFAAFLLATNPVLVFFAKFPVTEMVALAFSLNGVLYLIEGTRAKAARQKRALLAISVCCFCAFFFTRIHFMLYLPFFALVFVGAVAEDWRASLRSGLAPTIVVLCVLFGSSLGWYYVFQPALVTSLFGSHLLKLMSLKTLVVLTASGAGFVFCLLLGRRFLEPGFFKKPVSWVLTHAGKVFVLALLLSVPSLVSLSRTGLMPPFDQWRLDTGDPWLFRYHVLYRLLLFVSPVGLLVLSAAALLNRGLPRTASLLLLFLATAWGVVVLLQPWMPYLFYYGRYLASDVLPYSLVALAGLLAQWISKPRASAAVMVLVGAYQLFFSFTQLGFVEGEAPGTWEAFTSQTRPNDVILAVKMDDRLLVPLRVAKEQRVFAVNDLDVGGSPERLAEFIELQAFALEAGARFLIASRASDPQQIGTFLSEASLKTAFFTNGEHPLRGVMQDRGAVEALLLPLGREAKEERWVFYDATAVDLRRQFFQGSCAAAPSEEEAVACQRRLEAAGASDAEYVKGLYRDLLGREADPGGLRSHLDELIRGASREELKQAFLGSAEYLHKQQSLRKEP